MNEPLDDAEEYDVATGRRLPVKEIMTKSFSQGMIRSGQGVVRIRVDGGIVEIAFCATDADEFMRVMQSAADVIYKEKFEK